MKKKQNFKPWTLKTNKRFLYETGEFFIKWCDAMKKNRTSTSWNGNDFYISTLEDWTFVNPDGKEFSVDELAVHAWCSKLPELFGFSSFRGCKINRDVPIITLNIDKYKVDFWMITPTDFNKHTHGNLGFDLRVCSYSLDKIIEDN